jgi:hypothetical protein
MAGSRKISLDTCCIDSGPKSISSGLFLDLVSEGHNVVGMNPENEYRKREFQCGMRPSSLPSSLRYDAASGFDAARSAEWEIRRLR